MNYKGEAKEIIDCSIKEDAEQSAKALLMSLIEFTDYAGITLSDVRQLMFDIYTELECPEEKETEQEDPVCELYSGGILK